MLFLLGLEMNDIEQSQAMKLFRDIAQGVTDGNPIVEDDPETAFQIAWRELGEICGWWSK